MNQDRITVSWNTPQGVRQEDFLILSIRDYIDPKNPSKIEFELVLKDMSHPFQNAQNRGIYDPSQPSEINISGSYSDLGPGKIINIQHPEYNSNVFGGGNFLYKFYPSGVTFSEQRPPRKLTSSDRPPLPGDYILIDHRFLGRLLSFDPQTNVYTGYFKDKTTSGIYTGQGYHGPKLFENVLAKIGFSVQNGVVRVQSMDGEIPIKDPTDVEYKQWLRINFYLTRWKSRT